MFGIADYGAFVAAIVLFLAIPGPGNLALITSTSKGGIRGGLAATLGVIAGDQVLMWAAVAGVAALLAASPTAFSVVQWGGALYLGWLGWQMLPLTILLSSLVGAIVGVGLIVLAKRGRNVPIPFGPYLAAAGLLALFWGAPLTAAYLGML